MKQKGAGRWNQDRTRRWSSRCPLTITEQLKNQTHLKPFRSDVSATMQSPPHLPPTTSAFSPRQSHDIHMWVQRVVQESQLCVLESVRTWVQILTLTSTTCMTLDTCFVFSVPWLSINEVKRMVFTSQVVVRINETGHRRCLGNSENSRNLHYYVLWSSKYAGAKSHLCSSTDGAAWIFSPLF